MSKRTLTPTWTDEQMAAIAKLARSRGYTLINRFVCDVVLAHLGEHADELEGTIFEAVAKAERRKGGKATSRKVAEADSRLVGKSDSRIVAATTRNSYTPIDGTESATRARRIRDLNYVVEEEPGSIPNHSEHGSEGGDPAPAVPMGLSDKASPPEKAEPVDPYAKPAEVVRLSAIPSDWPEHGRAPHPKALPAADIAARVAGVCSVVVLPDAYRDAIRCYDANATLEGIASVQATGGRKPPMYLLKAIRTAASTPRLPGGERPTDADRPKPKCRTCGGAGVTVEQSLGTFRKVPCECQGVTHVA